MLRHIGLTAIRRVIVGGVTGIRTRTTDAFFTRLLVSTTEIVTARNGSCAECLPLPVSKSQYFSIYLFTAGRMQRGLGWRNSVRLGRLAVQCLSATHVLCDKTKEFTADVLIPYERTIVPVFDTNSDW